MISSALFLMDLESVHGGKRHDVVGVTHSNALSLYLALLGKGRKLPDSDNFTLRNRSTVNLGFIKF
jgi:broad specificity phosphatase PhoE